jgi:uncharacterized radical SAM superfamily protein
MGENIGCGRPQGRRRLSLERKQYAELMAIVDTSFEKQGRYIANNKYTNNFTFGIN